MTRAQWWHAAGLGVVVAAALGLSAPSAYAETSAERAEVLNEQGKELFKANRYYEAAKRFRGAIKLNDDPRYYFNHCLALQKLTRHQEALAECREAKKRSVGSSLVEKIDETIAELQAVLQGPEVQPTPPSETSGSSGGGPWSESPAERVQIQKVHEQPASARRRFGVGAEVGPLYNLSISKGNDQYRDVGLTTRINLSYALYTGPVVLGVRGFVGYSLLGTTDKGSREGDTLRFLDWGGSATIALPIGDRVEAGVYTGLSYSRLHAGRDQDFGTLGVNTGGLGSFAITDAHWVTLRANFGHYVGIHGAAESRATFFDLQHANQTVDVSLGYMFRL